jgi:hypothetical protein
MACITWLVGAVRKRSVTNEQSGHVACKLWHTLAHMLPRAAAAGLLLPFTLQLASLL